MSEQRPPAAAATGGLRASRGLREPPSPPGAPRLPGTDTDALRIAVERWINEGGSVSPTDAAGGTRPDRPRDA
jgi:hypothetical protein